MSWLKQLLLCTEKTPVTATSLHNHEDQDYVLLLHRCWSCCCSKCFGHLNHTYKYIFVLHGKVLNQESVLYVIKCCRIFSLHWLHFSSFQTDFCGCTVCQHCCMQRYNVLLEKCFVCYNSLTNDTWFDILWSNALIFIIVYYYYCCCCCCSYYNAVIYFKYFLFYIVYIYLILIILIIINC